MNDYSTPTQPYQEAVHKLSSPDQKRSGGVEDISGNELQASTSVSIPQVFPPNGSPRRLTPEERHAFIQWLQLDFFYELESTDWFESYQEIELSLDASCIVVFEHRKPGFSGNLLVVMNDLHIHVYSFTRGYEFKLEGEYEKI